MEALLHPSIELLGAVDLLGQADARLEPEDREYARALMKACGALRGHEAVVLNEKAHASDPNYFQRRDLLLVRSAPPRLTFDPAMSSGRSEAERSGSWTPWLAALRAFAREARWDRVFAEAAPLLAKDVAAMNAHLAETDYVGKIERYAGLPFRGRYRLVLSPLCPRGHGLNRVRMRDDGKVEIVSVLKPDSFRGRVFVDPGLDACLWHELCHGLMDLTIDLYDFEERDTPLSIGASKHDCRNWLHGIREHLVRAVMIRVIALEKGEKAGLAQLEREAFSAEPYLGRFVELLREYEKSRAKYPTLADFYPRLREAFPPRGAARGAAADLPAGPFHTPGQRAAALERLDLMLARSSDERLAARRRALAAAV